MCFSVAQTRCRYNAPTTTATQERMDAGGRCVRAGRRGRRPLPTPHSRGVQGRTAVTRGVVYMVGADVLGRPTPAQGRRRRTMRPRGPPRTSAPTNAARTAGPHSRGARGRIHGRGGRPRPPASARESLQSRRLLARRYAHGLRQRAQHGAVHDLAVPEVEQPKLRQLRREGDVDRLLRAGEVDLLKRG